MFMFYVFRSGHQVGRIFTSLQGGLGLRRLHSRRLVSRAHNKKNFETESPPKQIQRICEYKQIIICEYRIYQSSWKRKHHMPQLQVQKLSRNYLNTLITHCLIEITSLSEKHKEFSLS